jgi:hypothetical protein
MDDTSPSMTLVFGRGTCATERLSVSEVLPAFVDEYDAPADRRAATCSARSAVPALPGTSGAHHVCGRLPRARLPFSTHRLTLSPTSPRGCKQGHSAFESAEFPERPHGEAGLKNRRLSGRTVRRIPSDDSEHADRDDPWAHSCYIRDSSSEADSSWTTCVAPVCSIPDT